MWLLNVHTYQPVKLGPIETWPPYATVSHCRQNQHVTINHLHDVDTQDLNLISQTVGLPWIIRACSEAGAFGVDMLWVDSLSIDRTSSTEHSAAINSMFQIFQGAEICLVHLGDIDASKSSLENIGEQIRQSRWTKQIWMLQELIASEDLQFYDTNWDPIGTKKSLLPTLSRLLSIDEAVLEDSKYLSEFPVGRRMSWASQLSTARPEDLAYSLLGIFGVQLTVLYGEGARAAFIRLQEEISKNTDDITLFAWKSVDAQEYRGIFAHFPSEYAHFGVQSCRVPLKIRGQIQKSPDGILVCDAFVLRSSRADIVLCVLGENDLGNDLGNDRRIFAFPLLKWNNRYVRTSPSLLLSLDKLPIGDPERVCITRDVSSTASSNIAMQIACQFDFSNNEFGNKTSTSRSKPHAVKNIPYREQRSPIHKSADTRCLDRSSPIRNSDSLAASNHATYIFEPQNGAGRIAVSAVGSTSSFFLGSMVPFNETRSRQVGNKPPQVGTTAEATAQLWQQVLERRPRKRTREMSYASDSLDSEDTYSWSDSFDEISALDNDHPLMCFVEQLAGSCLGLFSQWMRSQAHKQISHTIPAVRKRQKVNGAFVSTRTQCNAHSVGMASTLTPGPEAMSLPFTCPFHIRAPDLHQSCLKHGGFSRLQDLCQHLSSSHRLPYFCPVCSEIFPKAPIRDDHIRKMTCDLGPEPTFEGVSENQIAQLLDRSKLLQSREAQWIEIWKNIFVGREHPPVSYFASNIELYIRSLRGFWTQNGEDVISDFLKSKDTKSSKIHANEQETMALHQMVLGRMVDGLIKLLMPTEGGLQNGKSFRQTMEEVQGG
ncbi:hypothetical protein B0J13DRAFT_567072 [Dactylonectria estremocensis]|uniref:Heterokaryon incompatibility domain-containing protein n=1 Tax=Dactylonectria estremocensis TaxID=1079267 RepID=A0A9P9DMV5_9HYPO|nr:hypothetical protein B0J13DRAFT_567072 [Dactylonectria estremocensis]